MEDMQPPISSLSPFRWHHQRHWEATDNMSTQMSPYSLNGSELTLWSTCCLLRAHCRQLTLYVSFTEIADATSHKQEMKVGERMGDSKDQALRRSGQQFPIPEEPIQELSLQHL